MFKFITHRSLLINILFGVFLGLLVIVTFFLTLGWITNHDNYESVPNITGKNIDAAKQMLEAKGFAVEVSDSVFIAGLPKLSITKQTPEADAVVKRGRTIYLTVNRSVAPTVAMPDLIGFSFKSAALYLENIGLKLGDTIYKPDWTKNTVREMLVNGISIKPGSKISVGSVVSLVISSGPGEEIEVPNLIGLTYADAMSYIGSLQLSLGQPLIDASVKDTANAFVIKQDPVSVFEPLAGQKVKNKIRVGQVIDLWLSATPPPDSLKAILPDSSSH